MITLPVAVSVRHIHLNATDWQKLFGVAPMSIDRPVTQPGQFIAVERVMLRGPKGEIGHVGVVGPIRPYTQVELSMTDCYTLGITAPVTTSGQLEQATVITIVGPAGTIDVRAAARQQRHLHLTPADAERYGLSDGQLVSVDITGARHTTFHQVLCRVSATSATMLHLDTDEGNAVGVDPDTVCTLLTT